MDLTRYVEELKQQLVTTAGLGGEEARALADRLVPHLDGMARLVLLDALSTAADEITTELAPGSVAVRLRGRDPEFEVVPPPAEVTSSDVTPTSMGTSTGSAEAPREAEEGEISRMTLRLPEHLKARVEQAAGAERLSVNAWLVRAVAGALEAHGRPPRLPTSTGPGSGQRLSGWAH